MCACVRVHGSSSYLSKRKDIVTAIPFLTLSRCGMGFPFPPLAVTPLKTLTEGHKAFC